MNNNDDLIAELHVKKDEFDQLLNGDFRPDHFVLVVQILAKISRANFTKILSSILCCSCFPTFIKNLESYLTKLPFETKEDKLQNKFYWNDINLFWSNLVEFFQKFTELFPRKARDELTSVLDKTNLIIATTEMNQDCRIAASIKERTSKICRILKVKIPKLETKEKVFATSSVQELQDPLEDFRTLSIIPTIQDVFNEKPFIRPNKLVGAYDSVEHYLDVQFRLLREDFMAPLRNGIHEYLNGSKKYSKTDVRVYRKVTMMNPEVAGNNIGVMVSFGILKFINWDTSKRFQFGGLVCLSSDNFSSIIFATIANRDKELLQRGTVLIKPCKKTAITHDHYHSNWVMLESKIYFEPYLAVLNAMCQMNEKNFPMRKYLVDADTTISLPHYFKTDAVLKYKGFSLQVGDYATWPTTKQLRLDETQYEAFKSGLSQEIAIIQGPPGTGKTFIALEIIRTLLENKEQWRCNGPIVIVCLTNHALDQFLEGVTKHTTSIVRVGSRSKNEALSQYTLGNKREARPRRNWCHDKWYQVKIILSNMKRTRKVLQDLSKRYAIVSPHLLYAYCHDETLQDMKNVNELFQWLLTHTDNSMKICETQSTNTATEMEIDGNSEFEEPIFPLEIVDNEIAEIDANMNEYRRTTRTQNIPVFPRHEVVQLKHRADTLKLQRSDLQRNLTQHPLLIRDNENFLPSLPWQKYWEWVELSYKNAKQKLTDLEEEYHSANEELNEVKQILDLSILREHDVIGFTTTCAARLYASLHALRPPIVLVEEAAEILESHVVCSLTQHCQHLILIGDHKQLRPKVAVHKLGSKYNFNISLFERMVNNRGSCTQLGHQHRMRPEIARLICPSVYKILHNHECVLEYPPVMGLEKNVFFITHDNPEATHDNQESWINPHEAKFLVAFARHLILQGYKSTEITILCTYAGQLFTLIKERNCHEILKAVRITTIDNFQGEENRIILLSLVRNNSEGNIGFLKEENRVCVALSRAREGLYIMGNMDNLTNKNNIWPKIKQVLENDNAIGDTLELRCKYHSDTLIKIRNGSDFVEQCPEGGCLQKCNTDLPCGHSCTSICHTLDREHFNFMCKQRCVKKCPDDHPCPLLCYQGCKPCLVAVERQLKCGHAVFISCGTDPDTYQCPVKVDVTLPHCNHTTEKSCYMPLDKVPCPYPCKIRLACGHSCEQKCHANDDPDHLEHFCHKPCSKRNSHCTADHPCKLKCYEKCIACPINVSKIRSCGHELNCKCSDDVEKLVCYKRIKFERICGHKATVRCFRKDDEECNEEVLKLSACGHQIKVKCCQTPSSSLCGDKCKLNLKCGHPCTNLCKNPCTNECKAPVLQTKHGLCGHLIPVPCFLKETEAKSPALLQYCKEPCKHELSCGHFCQGNCWSCKQGRIHKPCQEKCGKTLICGHRCDVPCSLECPPCQKPCEMKCKHSRCDRKCGETCIPCRETCAARCKHTICLKRCFELCNRRPCEKQCSKRLKCKHRCIGFCGEPCPPLCKICNKKELIDEFFLGYEDEPNARFVFLEDCGHCIENKGLLNWMSANTQTVQVKTCPRCSTPINKCTRILNEIKTHLKDVQLVKAKIFGDHTNLQNQQFLLVTRIKHMYENPVMKEFAEIMTYLKNLSASVSPITKTKRRQTLDARATEATRIVLDILQDICRKLEKVKSRTVPSYISVKNQLTMLLKSLPTRGQISQQEINDIERESQRLHYLVEVCTMESEAGFDEYHSPADKRPYNSVLKKLLQIEKFSESSEEEVKTDLNQLRTLYRMKNVINNERKMIVKVMGFRQGHWYKCPNGHIYAIGDCGRAMQESHCNECGAAIGGSSHRLRNDNTAATEMN
ncbi:NFX1-type zinc finger-containing protein 1-like isoform X3 [Neodiprion virginianus]|nr:NFX1-type zinc finger-containing protein 1-like isoform X3 [Neodiprion virginianus]XP_046620437.1 NFX1-type zinc finger-containing protein 1-like isoform X3 [Neodiprion virginianus]